MFFVQVAFSDCLIHRIFYVRRVKPMQFLILLLILMIPLAGLTGCATAEEDADTIADTAVKGLSGQGQLSNEKVMKGDMGSGQSFGNDFQ